MVFAPAPLLVMVRVSALLCMAMLVVFAPHVVQLPPLPLRLLENQPPGVPK